MQCFPFVEENFCSVGRAVTSCLSSTLGEGAVALLIGQPSLSCLCCPEVCGGCKVGTTGVANADVRQEVAELADDAGKLLWLQARIQDFVDHGGWSWSGVEGL
jgi:hypothetical protein